MTIQPITIVEPTIRPLGTGRLKRLRRPAHGALARLEPGDLLWIREPFRFQAKWDHLSPTAAAAAGAVPIFTASLAPGAAATLSLGKARYARNLPRICHRHHLRVIAVAREPLQLMTEAEMRAEGYASRNGWVDAWDKAMALTRDAGGQGLRWSDNPEILVIDFELHKRPAPTEPTSPPQNTENPAP